MLQSRISPAYAETIPSPLDPAHSAILVETRPTAPIAAAYLRDFDYDCSEDFAGLEEIAVYECSATGYRFFYPYSLQGKEKLYRAIEDTDWCYEEAKWEHVAVADLIAEDASVLDIGCGRGAFLSKLKTARATGIELNKSAAEFARQRDIEVVESLIATHAAERPEAYDVVTAFQVLEHIADPMPFLRDCLAALKPGGLFVLAVPNNDAHSLCRFAPKSASASCGTLESAQSVFLGCVPPDEAKDLNRGAASRARMVSAGDRSPLSQGQIAARALL